VFKKFQHYIEHQCVPFHQKQSNQPYFTSLVFLLNNILLVFHLLNMFVIILFRLCPHESFKVWNFSTFLQKCSLIQDCASSLSHNFYFTPLHLHHPLVVLMPSPTPLWITHCHLHLCGWLYFYFNNVLLPYVHLRYWCFHKVLLRNFVSSNFSMNTGFINVSLGHVYYFAQKLNYRCSNYIYVLNYCLHKL
jgi:hypothetical protein